MPVESTLGLVSSSSWMDAWLKAAAASELPDTDTVSISSGTFLRAAFFLVLLPSLFLDCELREDCDSARDISSSGPAADATSGLLLPLPRPFPLLVLVMVSFLMILKSELRVQSLVSSELVDSEMVDWFTKTLQDNDPRGPVRRYPPPC